MKNAIPALVPSNTAAEVMTRRAIDLLGTMRNDAYEAALAALRGTCYGNP
jgi:hypothetical protein